MRALKATVLDDDHFRLLAIPFGGPIPHPAFPRGVDLDAQTFSEATDIKPEWFTERAVDWHHGQDAMGNPGNRKVLGRTVIAKATNLTLEDDGWWVDVWLKHGEARLSLIKRLAERGAQLFGSSETIQGTAMLRTVKGTVVPWQPNLAGEIVFWPYWRQTLSTSPQNTHSVLRPLKAALADIDSHPSPAFWADLRHALDDLGKTSDPTSGMGEGGAKAGRVLSAINEEALRLALASIGDSVARLDSVLAKLKKESDGTEPES